MLQDYLPILILLLLGLGLAGLMMLLSWGLPIFMGTRRPNPTKLEPYESGMVPVGQAQRRFSVQFYLPAVLFILFDIEVIFLFPWAVAFRDLGLFGFVEMLVFIGILLVGYVYILRKGALDWR